jgi:RNA polymerase sigma-70 factor (ECF subfamily)
MTPIEIERIFRDEAGRALATLIRLVGDFDLAEEVLQDAFAVALELWPEAAPPSNPRAGWSMSDATRRSTGCGGRSIFAASRRN